MNLPSELSDRELQAIGEEFHRVKGKCYLDHAGATLYSERQIDLIHQELRENLYGNPHTSKATEDLIDQVRYRILKHFKTDSSQHDVVFTSGATASLKLVAECFDFGETGSFCYVQENHTSVLGMRESVQTETISTLSRDKLLSNLEMKNRIRVPAETSGNNLITFSAQCNFSGFKYPLNVIDKIHQYGLDDMGKPLVANNKIATITNENQNYVCLDAATFAASNLIDLSRTKADFVCVSFYKIFGYPTGLGALIVSKRGQKVLKKKYFGGGTVKIAMSKTDFHEKRDCFHERFEDGTLSFLSIVALLPGFSTIERLMGSDATMVRISRHIFQLAKYCFNELKVLTYPNQKPLVQIYSYTDYCSEDTQGGVIAFNLLHDDGSYIGYAEVACIASIYNIVLRTGCFCNPGACQTHLKLRDNEIRKHFQAGHVCGDFNDLVDGVPTGAVRISFGYMSRVDDVHSFLHMLKDCYLRSKTKRYKLLENANIPMNLLHIKDRIKPLGNKIRLRQICIYPIKSCGSFKINDRWELTSKGLRYDRSWMIVNANGVAVTQKSNTKLCLIRPEINLKQHMMILHNPDMDSIAIPLVPSADRIVTSSLCQSKVCGDFIEGIDCGDEVADWLSEYLDMQDLRLIQQHDGLERLGRNGNVKDINLSNQAQFLLINYSSVVWLASKVEDWADTDGNDVDGIVDRFRGNLIVETAEPLEENSFRSLKIGGIEFRIEGSCTRCQMICIDPRTGERTCEPLRTIAREFRGKLRFGIYLSLCQFSKKCFISCSDDIVFD